MHGALMHVLQDTNMCEACKKWTKGRMHGKLISRSSLGMICNFSCLMVKTEDIDENGNAVNVGDDKK